MRWKIPMPKEQPKEGHSHIVIAIKGKRQRLEFQAQIPTNTAEEVIEQLMRAQAEPLQPSSAAAKGDV